MKTGTTAERRSCSSALLLYPLHHIDCVPGAVLRAELTPNANFFIDNDYSVDAHVAVLIRILGAGDLVQTIHGAEFNANFASGTSFGMNNGNDRRLLFLLGGWRYYWRRGWRS